MLISKYITDVAAQVSLSFYCADHQLLTFAKKNTYLELIGMSALANLTGQAAEHFPAKLNLFPV
ncbi:hypothetical protein SAMN02745824_1485 [Parasphingorhabdus marina DSM 22363]|uniref:Uncharacterized protein n=1 Tax=Parasphingorhabdus marina DSM 22363 TaxID=1123272 RepID=A0A1N6D3A4_9SPHN|nr:hypothetical protein [Parasphingorhabdus marina]SIN65219.1 hypothetical protein SAMN02745824_1485 [Parasphingorhabdus marina DSM 22363]